MRQPSSETGQATVFVVGMALVALAVTAFAIDGTRAFLMRRTLQNAADAAAVAGASQLDRDSYYSSGGVRTLLDPSNAEETAASWLDKRALDADAVVTATPGEVKVLLTTELPTRFLRLLGIGSVRVSGDAVAEPILGEPGG